MSGKMQWILGTVVVLLALALVGVTSYAAGHHQRELDQIHGQLSTEVEARKELELRVRRIEERRGGTGATQ